MPGVGTLVHNWIKDRTGTEPSNSCTCRAFIAKMDANPPQWSRDHLDEIVPHLVSEARKNPLQWRIAPYDTATGRTLNWIVNRVWKGTMIVPGSGMLIEPFVRMMVLDCITKAEDDDRP